MYACPKFIAANPPPYHNPALLVTYLATPAPALEPAQLHLALFLADVRAQLAVPTLRSFLKLYTSLDANKLAGFLDKDEEDVVQEMMVMKQASRSVSLVVGSEKDRGGDEAGNGAAGGLLGGQTISTSDLDFVIDEVNPLHAAADFRLLKNICRTWFTLQNLPSVDAMRVGSSEIRSTPSECLTPSAPVRFPLQHQALPPTRV